MSETAWYKKIKYVVLIVNVQEHSQQGKMLTLLETDVLVCGVEFRVASFTPLWHSLLLLSHTTLSFVLVRDLH